MEISKLETTPSKDIASIEQMEINTGFSRKMKGWFEGNEIAKGVRGGSL